MALPHNCKHKLVVTTSFNFQNGSTNILVVPFYQLRPPVSCNKSNKISASTQIYFPMLLYYNSFPILQTDKFIFTQPAQLQVSLNRNCILLFIKLQKLRLLLQKINRASFKSLSFQLELLEALN